MSDMYRKTRQGTILILAGIEEMSGIEVKDRIGKAKYRTIRERDPHPMFVELLAGHEGWSTGKLATGTGSKKSARKHWSREKISELTHRLRSGVPVYLFHSQKNKPRQPVGEIVVAAERWMKGILGACGIAYITDPEVKKRIKTGELDTCSIEAEVECHRNRQDPDDSWMVDAVRKVTGIALGNSRLHKPGFPGATLLAAVEEFVPAREEDPKEDNESRVLSDDFSLRALDSKLKNKPSGEIDKADLSAFNPSQLFNREKLLDDPVVSEMIRACRERDAERIHELSCRLDTKGQRIKDLSVQLEDYQADKEKRNQAIKSEEVAEKVLAGRNVTKEERALILDEIRSRPPESGDGLEIAVKAKVDEELQKMDRLRELWTMQRIPSPPESESGGDTVLNNPLIPRPRGW